MKLYIGVDGGGTKTEVLVLHGETGQIFRAVGGPSNPSTVGWARALETIETLVTLVIHDAGGCADDVIGLSLCMAGVDRPDQVDDVKRYFQERFQNTAMDVANDGLAALTAGTKGQSGVVLIAGTGSIAVGEAHDGQAARAGGYGSLVGDEGSGFYMGRRGLMAALQYQEDRGQATVLWDRAATLFNLKRPSEIIRAVYQSEHPVGTVASFAQYVLEAAREDDVARRIVEDSARHHVAMVESVRKQLRYNVSNQVILSGGLFTKTPVLLQTLVDTVLRQHLELDFIPCSVSPAAGAVLRAMRTARREKRVLFPPGEDYVDEWERSVGKMNAVGRMNMDAKDGE